MREEMNERIGRWGQVRIYTGKFYRIFLHERGWKFIAFAVVIAVLLSVVMGDKMFVEKEFTRTGMFAIVTAMIWVECSTPSRISAGKETSLNGSTGRDFIYPPMWRPI